MDRLVFSNDTQVWLTERGELYWDEQRHSFGFIDFVHYEDGYTNIKASFDFNVISEKEPAFTEALMELFSDFSLWSK